MLVLHTRQDLVASQLRRDLPATSVMIKNVLGNNMLKREEIFDQLKSVYGISHELACDKFSKELSDMVKDGKLTRPTQGYYKAV